MSAAMYLVFEDEVAGFDPFVNGKALSRCSEDLDALAERAGVKPLIEFFSMSAEDMEDMTDMLEGEVPSGMGEEAWFPAADVRAVVVALAQAVRSEPDAVDDADAVLSDLAEYETVLARAQELGLRCHVAVDA